MSNANLHKKKCLFSVPAPLSCYREQWGFLLAGRIFEQSRAHRATITVQAYGHRARQWD